MGQYNVVIHARLRASFSLPPLPVLPFKTGRIEHSQVESGHTNEGSVLTCCGGSRSPSLKGREEGGYRELQLKKNNQRIWSLLGFDDCRC